jgi:SNF2 family DNA or RNA helicase
MGDFVKNFAIDLEKFDIVGDYIVPKGERLPVIPGIPRQRHVRPTLMRRIRDGKQEANENEAEANENEAEANENEAEANDDYIDDEEDDEVEGNEVEANDDYIDDEEDDEVEGNPNDKEYELEDELENELENELEDKGKKEKQIESIDWFIDNYPKMKISYRCYLKNILIENESKLLTENNTRFKDYKLTGTSLYLHQQSLVKAMIDYENCGGCKMNIYNIKKHVVLKTTCGHLSESFGSGKTICVLTLILNSPVPPMRGEKINLYKNDIYKNVFLPTITRKKKNLINATIILVNKSVLFSWIETIELYTNLKYFVVDSFRKLEEFEQILPNINYYDVILVKFGNFSTISKKYIPSEKQNYPLISAVINLTNKSTWARFVFDDYDAVGCSCNNKLPSALFSWYISGSYNNDNGYKTYKYNPTDLWGLYSTAKYGSILCNNYYRASEESSKNMFRMYTIKCKDDFRQMSQKTPKIIFYKYTVKGGNDNAVRLLGPMVREEVIEMINSDSPGEAYAELNKKVDSVGNLLELLLKENIEKYKFAIKWKQVIENIKDKHPKFSVEDINTINELYEILDKKERVVYHEDPDNIKNICIDLIVRFKTTETKISKTLQRVKDNIGDGDCPVCMEELEEVEGSSILKCCGTVICIVCTFPPPRELLIRSCPNCLQGVEFKNIVIINKKLELDKLLDDTQIYKELDSTKEEVVDLPEVRELTSIKNPKLRILVDIINGQTPQKDKDILSIEQFEPNINGILNGDSVVESDAPKKVLVFSNYTESLNLIKDCLRDQNINFLQLNGTSKQVFNIIKEFRDSPDIPVLIIKARKYCAGVNLQFATDLVFYHKIYSGEVESQVIGRIQRIGRKTSAKVHYISYTHEFRR